MEWILKSKHVFLPIRHLSFQLHSHRLPLDPAKVKDLRTLSVYLQSYMSQDTIDDLYPCPEGESGDSSNDEADGEDDDAHDE